MSKFQKNLKRGLVVVAAAGTSVVANAGDYSTQIAAASTEASTNQTAVILAVIGIAVLGFGVTALMSFLKK